MEIEVVGTEPDRLGECPLWDGRTTTLYWIDIDGKAIHSLDAANRLSSHSLAGRPGSIALTDDEQMLLMSMEHEVGMLDWRSGRFTAWVALEDAGTGNRMNDGRCDPEGRFWVGSMYERASERLFTGMLHRLEADRTSTIHERGIGVSNGLAFSPDGATMYFADTLVRTVWAYDYDSDTGARTNQRVFSDFSGLPGRPDGACVDAEGCYWIACVYGWAVARLTPRGTVDRIIELPVEKPTMPAFGGPGLGTLFVTSISAEGSISGGPDPAQRNAGKLLAIDVGATGRQEPQFARSPLERSNTKG